jgi:hypothetical protein
MRLLAWLNLLDSDGNLSITNVAVVALVIKMLLAPQLDWPSVVAMIVTFTNYMHKRQTSDGAIASDETDEMKAIKAQYEAAVVAQAKAISDLQSKIGNLSGLAEMLKMGKKP